jgi:hypothetical protein
MSDEQINIAIAEACGWREHAALARKLERERDRLAEEIDKLRDIAEMLYELAMKNDVKWSFEEDGDSLAKLGPVTCWRPTIYNANLGTILEYQKWQLGTIFAYAK